MRRVMAGCSALVWAFLLAGCTGAGETTTPSEPLGSPDSMITIASRDLAFDVTTVEARVGEVVEIAFANIGALPHDFTIDDVPADLAVLEPANRVGRSGSDIHVLLNARNDTRFQLRVTKPGEYLFYCSISGHRRAGMEGRLVIHD
jgi:uncharacterized cupredoxin-like copper-binding protein